MRANRSARVGIDAVSRLPDDLQERVERRLASLVAERVVDRIWRGDHTVWKPEPREIVDRLGWLRAPTWSRGHLGEMERLRSELLADGFTDLLLLGMGGSSLAAAVLATYGERGTGLRFHLLDTTNPEEIVALESRLDLTRTAFVVASKSGTTVETLSQLAYFWEHSQRGAQFIAITDEGTPLARIAAERGFRRTFLNPPDIGGRYSALSYFGLVPAVACGLSAEPFLAEAEAMATACQAPAERNPGAWLGAILGEAALLGREKLHLLLPREGRPFGAWVEQLVAESTGKESKGILPVLGDGLPASPDGWGDRLVVAEGGRQLPDLPTDIPTVLLPSANGPRIGAGFFRWEFATAVAGHVLGINPFDQPNVQEAKDATARALRGELPAVEAEPLADVLAAVQPGWYVALLAWISETDEHDSRLEAAAEALRARTGCPVTVGYGPRYLHSTGQLHKGGTDRGAFIQVVGARTVDLPVPGAPYSFGQLFDAQAQGDLASLRARGRRVARVTLEELEAALER